MKTLTTDISEIQQIHPDSLVGLTGGSAQTEDGAFVMRLDDSGEFKSSAFFLNTTTFDWVLGNTRDGDTILVPVLKNYK